jgi:hydrogenase expression/formation protein HypC
MCLATPMKIERIVSEKKALVSQGGVSVEVDISLLQDPKPGDHVIVHAGFAIETLSLEEAEERLALFRRLAELSGEAGSA